MIKYISFFILLFFSLPTFGNTKADSLLSIILTEEQLDKRAFEISSTYSKLSASNLEIAYQFLEQVDSLFKLEPSKINTPTLLLLRSNKHYKVNEQIKALELAINSIEGFDSIQTPTEYVSMLKVRALLAAGAAHSQTGNFDAAIEYQIQALTLADEIDFVKGKAETNNLLAITYFSSKVGLAQSINYFEEAIKHASELRDSFMIATIYGNMATVFIFNEELDLAIDYLNKAISINTLLKLDIKKGFNYYYLGGVLVKKNQIEQAEYYAEMATKIFRENKYIRGFPLVYSLWGNIYAQKEDWEKAISNYKLALEHTPAQSQHKYRVDLYRRLGELENKRGNFEKANEYFQANIVEQDSINKRLNLNTIVNSESSYKLREIEKEKAFLKREKGLLSEVISTQRKSLFLLVALLLGAIFAGFIVWTQKKKLNQSHKVLVDKNRALIQKHLALATPIVSKNKKTNWDIDSTIKDLIPKISHALEHEKIYLNQDLTGKKLADYLGTNTSYLTKAINTHYNKNFSSLLKEYRVNEVLQAIEEGKHKVFTLETLAQQAGFTSKSVFFTAFKNQTGITPSFYIKQIDRKND